ncbi:MAG: exodeoxyribonuclease VII large subunit [Candidatus Obscuribacterales bacterium]|nr:exodeoxyribonuclease VII large subunit [Candidatus Obscuribacterales bacterium]
MYSPKESNPLHPVLTISELTGQVKDLLESAFDHIYVAGEISNAKVYPSGHWYFSLKDQNATLPCVCFKNANQSIKFKLEDGLSVIARGKLSVYPPRGAYQMMVTKLEPVGVGEWQLAFEQLKEQLASEGLLAPERKRTIPMLPKRVGIVTSPQGAAIRDIINTLSRRNNTVKALIAPAKVQGDGSAESIAAALDLLFELHDRDELDVIIVARGGGSIEDLWSFNTEIVARAVCRSPVPVISGVGHETDITICDLVADLRAPTPTAAAELVASGRAELLEKFKNLSQNLLDCMDERLDDCRYNLERLSPLSSLLRYQDRLGLQSTRIAHTQQILLNSISSRITHYRHRLSESTKRLNDLGPKNVMNRGFSIVRTGDGSIISDLTATQEGDILEVLLKNGRLSVTVTKTHKDWWG